MSVNSYLPHILVLPEDTADRQLANGFHLEVDHIRQMQVLPVAKGWEKVLTSFRDDHVKDMERYPARLMVLLIDFDEREDRFVKARAYIPSHLAERVFILGAINEPEDLKRAKLGHLEAVGAALAKDCRDGTDTTWNHALLQHNASELARLRQNAHPVLF